MDKLDIAVSTPASGSCL